LQITHKTRREEIGILTSLPLLHKVVEDLETARNNERSSLTLYFTKESHIHTLVNLVLLSGLPIANRRIPELDYAVCFFSFSYSIVLAQGFASVFLFNL
jgi:inositol-hexakisphosphate/diphosphoinositol-pentakisphosphate 1-kinase